jgi:cold shock CspA family protein
MAMTWNKKEREQKKRQEKKKKEERKQERKNNAVKGKSLDDMMAYLDENGNLTSEPPDPRKRETVKLEDINISVPKQKAPDPDDLLRKGVVTLFNHQKGFGFIKDLETKESLFVHTSATKDVLHENNRVIFEIEKGPKGLTAVNVRLDK